jgi:hypothetical protein
MADADPDPLALKRALSPLLLALPGVSGVGVRDGKVCVYLAHDDALVRRAVEHTVHSRSPDAAVLFEVTGRFVKR